MGTSCKGKRETKLRRLIQNQKDGSKKTMLQRVYLRAGKIVRTVDLPNL